MGGVKEHLAKGRKVRGIVIASDYTLRAEYTARMVPDLRLVKYQISFRFADAGA